MAWSIDLNLSESFAEVVACQNSQRVGTHWFMPRQSLSSGLQKFKEQHLGDETAESVRISVKSVQKIIERRLGTSPALLVTGGFENWLEMSLPIHQDYFTTQPDRVPPLVPRDFVFGVNERVSASGTIEKAVDHEQLEFLVSKLKMNNIQSVAVAFLHAHKNASNETTVAHFLKEYGFKVYCSSQYENFNNEKNAWWAALLTTYLAPTFEEIFSHLQEDIKKVFNTSEILLTSPHGDINSADSPHILSTQFGYISELLEQHSELNGAGLFYLGYEEFIYIPLEQNASSKWSSPFGDFFIKKPNFKKLRIQPSQIINETFWGSAGYTQSEAGFEPGPMTLGRGHNPTFFDVLLLKDRFKKLPHLQELSTSQGMVRANESLEALSRVAHNRNAFNQKDLLTWLEEIALMDIVMELQKLSLSKKVHCIGPLAQAVIPQIQEWDVKLDLIHKALI